MQLESNFNFFVFFHKTVFFFILQLLNVVIAFRIYEYSRIKTELMPLMRTTDTYSNFDAISYAYTLVTTSLAMTVFFAWIKLLKYLSVFNSMNELQKTVHKVSQRIASFF